MKFCKKCGAELAEDAKFCNICGEMCNAAKKFQDSRKSNETEQNIENAATVYEENSNTSRQENSNEISGGKRNKKLSKKGAVIIGAIVIAILIPIIVSVIVNIVSMNNYKKLLEDVYYEMIRGAENAEDYCTLESKVWRNCIYENSSSETDKYTKDEYGYFYSDFNDALLSFYVGESWTYNIVDICVANVNSSMTKLKNCPEKLKDEYRAIKEMYVAFYELTDMVIGNSSYSYNSFSEALESARSNFKSARSTAKVLIE